MLKRPEFAPVKILLTAATAAEIAPAIEALQTKPSLFDVRVCVTGVGICAATLGLTEGLISGKYDLVIAAGIAGSFDRSLPLGTVVRVTRDCFGDLGVEDNGTFLDLQQLQLAKPEDVCIEAFSPEFPENLSKIVLSLPTREAITVHTATGTALTAAAREKRFGPVLESMEGAAFHYVCRHKDTPLLHLRAISNYAEARNRPAWDIPRAVQNLNAVLKDLLF